MPTAASLLERFKAIKNELAYVEALNHQAHQEENLFFDQFKAVTQNIEIDQLTTTLKRKRENYISTPELLQFISMDEKKLTEDNLLQLQGIYDAQYLVYKTRETLLHTLKEKVEVIKNPTAESTQQTLDQVHERIQLLMQQIDELETHGFKENLDPLLTKYEPDKMETLLTQVKLTIDLLQKPHFQLNIKESKNLIDALKSRILSAPPTSLPSSPSFVSLLENLWPKGPLPINTETSFLTYYINKEKRETQQKRLQSARNFLAECHPEKNQVLLNKITFYETYQQYLDKQTALLLHFKTLENKLAALEILAPTSLLILGVKEKLASFSTELNFHKGKIPSSIAKLSSETLNTLLDEQEQLETLLTDNDLLMNSVEKNVTKQMLDRATGQEIKSHPLFKASQDCLEAVKDEYLRILDKYGNTGQICSLKKYLMMPANAKTQLQMNELDPRLKELALIYQGYQQCNLNYLTKVIQTPQNESPARLREQYQQAIVSQTQATQNKLETFPDRVDTVWGKFKRFMSKLLSKIWIAIQPTSTRTIEILGDSLATLQQPHTPITEVEERSPSFIPEEAFRALVENYETLSNAHHSMKMEFEETERLNSDSPVLDDMRRHLDAMRIELLCLNSKIMAFSAPELTQERVEKLAPSLAILNLRGDEIKEKLSQVMEDYHEKIVITESQVRSLMKMQKRHNDNETPIGQHDPLKAAKLFVSTCKQLLKDHLEKVELSPLEKLSTGSQQDVTNISTSEIKTLGDALLINLKRRLTTNTSDEMNAQVKIVLADFKKAKQFFLDFHEVLVSNPTMSPEEIHNNVKYHLAQILKDVNPRAKSTTGEIKALHGLTIMILMQTLNIIEKDVKKYAATVEEKAQQAKKLEESADNMKKAELLLSLLQQQHLQPSQSLSKIQEDSEQVLSGIEQNLLPTLLEEHQQVINSIHATIQNLDWTRLTSFSNETPEAAALNNQVARYSVQMDKLKKLMEQVPSLNLRDPEPFRTWQQDIELLIDEAKGQEAEITRKEEILNAKLKDSSQEMDEKQDKNMPRL